MIYWRTLVPLRQSPPLASHQLVQNLWPMKIIHQLLITHFFVFVFLAAISLTMAVPNQKALANLATTHIQISFSYGSKFLNLLLFSFILVKLHLI